MNLHRAFWGLGFCRVGLGVRAFWGVGIWVQGCWARACNVLAALESFVSQSPGRSRAFIWEFPKDSKILMILGPPPNIGTPNFRNLPQLFTKPQALVRMLVRLDTGFRVQHALYVDFVRFILCCASKPLFVSSGFVYSYWELEFPQGFFACSA